MLEVVVVHAGDKVRRDVDLPTGVDAVELTAARNQAEVAQVVLRTSVPMVGPTVEATDLVGPPGSAPLSVELLLQHYVEVVQPTTPAASPGWYPDALPPLTGPVELEPGVNQSVWLKIRVPEAQAAGAYAGHLDVGGHRVPVSLRVRDLTLPVAGHCPTAFAIWYDQVADHYGVAHGSDQHWEIAERFYWFQLEHRLPPDDLPFPSDLPAEEWLARAERLLTDPRVIAYRIPARSGDLDRTRAIVSGLRERGWLERGYFYLDEIDEPTAGGIEEPAGGDAGVRRLCARLHEIAPDVRHLVTAEPVPELEGAVRTWVPLFDRYDPEDAARRAAHGERFWWYGCIYPAHPHPTYHLDDDSVAARIVPWMMYRWGIEGNLYWATTIYSRWDGHGFVPRDPWTDPVAWPVANGDGFLIYPGGDGQPVSSVRLEAIRAGQDDYEYLWLLERSLRDAAARLGVADVDPAAVVASYTARLFRSTSDFDRDPRHLASVRDEVADHIERLRGAEASPADLQPATTCEAPAPPERVVRALLEHDTLTAHRAEVTVAEEAVTLRTEHADGDRPRLTWSGVLWES